ncbi:MAG: cache domain-containing protein [Desulfamplus sp.]|nr:cache domain-containing protein [Desulfamplus sp.]
MGLNSFKIRNKLLLTFLLLFIPFMIAGSFIGYLQIKKLLQANIEQALFEKTESLVTAIRGAASISIKNRLRAIAEKNLDITQYYYNKYRSGLISRTEAMNLIEEIFLSQSVGISGYIYCLDSNARVVIHPNEMVKGSDVSDHGFVMEQIKTREGYLEYEWQNPGEPASRPKALYMTYFKPLDWIISVSSYRSEFNDLIELNDIRAMVLSYRIGETGYAYILNENGFPLVHPRLKDEDFIKKYDFLSKTIENITSMQRGTLLYKWKNPGDTEVRDKITIFDYIDEYRWVVGSSSDIYEIMAPLKKFRNMIFFMLAAGVVVLIILTYAISRFLTRPMDILMDKIGEAAKGDFSVRMDYHAKDEFGELSRYFDYFMDQLELQQNRIRNEIAGHIRTQEILKKNEFKFRGIFNQLFHFSGVLSASGVVEDINQTALDMMGCTREDVMHRFFWETPCWHHDPDEQNRMKISIERAAQGDFIRYEAVHLSGTGEIREIDISIKPVLDGSGRIIFIIVEGRDITDMKLAEQARIKMAVELQRAQKMESIGTLAGGIAHDFNNVLSIIFGYGNLLKLHVNDPEKVLNYLGKIELGAERAKGLINQILTFSRKADHDPRPLKIAVIVKEALKMIRAIIPTTIEIVQRVNFSGLVMADATHIHQIVMNLCTNAYHAMGETGGTLTIEMKKVAIYSTDKITEPVVNDKIPPVPRDPGSDAAMLTVKKIVIDDKIAVKEFAFDDQSSTDSRDNSLRYVPYLEMKISDTGCGMDENTRARIFEPYFTTKEAGKGTGLGLAVVHGIVARCNGHITVESRPDQGTSISLYLPLFEPDGSYENGEPRHTNFGPGREKIMIVDDEESLILATSEILQDYGYEVDTFDNGLDALIAFKKNPGYYDLVISDVTMPKMNGVELSRRILEIRPDIPIIICTGYSRLIDDESARKMGIREYHEKPLGTDKLLSIIRNIFDDPKSH